MIKKVWKENRVYFLLFAVIIIAMSIMDIVIFRPRDSGFWSIRPNQVDAFHLFKQVAIGSIMIGFIKATWEFCKSFREFSYIVIVYVMLAFGLHEFILHQLF